MSYPDPRYFLNRSRDVNLRRSNLAIHLRLHFTRGGEQITNQPEDQSGCPIKIDPAKYLFENADFELVHDSQLERNFLTMTRKNY